MDIVGIVFISVFYLLLALLTCAFSDANRVGIYRWVRDRRTEEARNAAWLLLVIFWGIWFPIYVLWPLWRGLKYLGRGFRDLLPVRVKLPEARVINE